MTTSVVKSSTAVPPTAHDGGTCGVHGLHLLSAVVDSYLHQQVSYRKSNISSDEIKRYVQDGGKSFCDEPPKGLFSLPFPVPVNSIPVETRRYGHVHSGIATLDDNLIHHNVQVKTTPRVSACSSPTDEIIDPKHIPSLQAKERSAGKAKNNIPVRVSRPVKGSTSRSAVFASRSKIGVHFSSTLEDLKLVRPNLVPPSPTSVLVSKNPTLTLMSQNNKQHNDGTVPHPSSISCFSPTAASPNVPATALMANGERITTKKSMAELNYIKHKAVPMREKWMSRFLELAEFKKKYGHSKLLTLRCVPIVVFVWNWRDSCFRNTHIYFSLFLF